MENKQDLPYYIYAHINPVKNEIFYIGKGTGRRAFSKQRSNKYWHNIVNKYDYDIILIEENLNEADAYKLEKYWIKRIGRKDLGLGSLINLSDGGEGESGRIFTKEHVNKIKLSNKGKLRSQSTKDNCSKAKSGINNPNFGKTKSIDIKNKISESLKTYHLNKHDKNGK